MKNLYLVLPCILSFTAHAQDIVFPDSYFKDALLRADEANNMAKNLEGDYFKIDANNDDEIQQSEAAQVSELMLAGQYIAYFDGISYFNNLETLDCTNNGREGTPLGSGNPISLDISGMPNLKNLIAPSNTFYLGIDSFTNLEVLNIDSCLALDTDLDMTNFTNLKTFYCAHTHLASLNVTGLTALEYLGFSHNDISAIDLSQTINLKQIDASWTPLATLDVSNHTQLENLHCGNSELATLYVNGCTNLKKINGKRSRLISLDAGNLPQLEELLIDMNELTALNVSGSSNLRILSAQFGQLATLDAGNLPNLEELKVTANYLTSINTAGSPLIKKFYCTGNQLTSLDCNDLPQLQSLICNHNLLVSLYVKNGSDELEIQLDENPGLSHICADASQVDAIQTMIAVTNPDCVVDSNCGLLQTDNFAQAGQITIHPNPAEFVLNIETDPALVVSEMKIFNSLGQSVLSPEVGTAIDISALQAGNYILKVVSDAETTAKLFVKK